MQIKSLFFIAVIGVFLTSGNLYGQRSSSDTAVFLPFLDFSFAVKAPGGDMADRFGPNSEIGVGMFFKTKKNFIWGADWHYIFGGEVKEQGFADVFRDKSSGLIMGNNGLYSELFFTERGFTLSGKVGGILPLFAANANSGVMILGGVGYIQHRIKIEDKFQEVPLLSSDPYIKGYDRYTNGVMFTQFIGYRYLSERRLINVFGGFEFNQGLTKNRREVNFDTGLADDKNRIDAFYGIRLGISLLLYKPTPKDYYYR